MPTHQFGGQWTEEKLNRIKKYLSAYMTIFKSNPRASKLNTIFSNNGVGLIKKRQEGVLKEKNGIRCLKYLPQNH